MAYPTIVLDSCNMRPPAIDPITCAPTTTDGEVTEVLFTSTVLTAEELADAELLAARIDNAPDAAPDVIRWKVTGKFLPGEPTTQRVEGGNLARSAKIPMNLECDAYNDSDTNYEAVRYMQYGGKPILIYFVMGGKIYGGASTVEEGISTLANIIGGGEGFGTLFKYTMKMTWEAPCQPKRMAYALA